MSQASSVEIEMLSEQLGKKLQARGWKLATAESCTGGWVGQAITAIAGSSMWYDRGYITYSNRAKQEELGVGAEQLQQQGAVSEAVVVAMAQGALARSGCDLAVAVSGIAGPGGGTAQKPVGTVCFGWAHRDHPARCETRRLPGDRQAVREQSVVIALHGLIALCDAG